MAQFRCQPETALVATHPSDPALCPLRAPDLGPEDHPEQDEASWVRLETACEEFATVDAGHSKFATEFRPHLARLRERMFFLCRKEGGEVVGTASAWDKHIDGKLVGSLHWVAIHPDYQGRGLAKVVVGAALNRLREVGHTWAWLTTQTTSARAVKLYLRLGFVPFLRAERLSSDTEGWQFLEHLFGHAIETTS